MRLIRDVANRFNFGVTLGLRLLSPKAGQETIGCVAVKNPEGIRKLGQKSERETKATWPLHTNP